MDHTHLLNVINKRLFIILLTVMLAVLGTGVTCMITPFKYQAKAVLMVNQTDPATGELRMDYNSLMMYRQLARTYSELATSKPVLQKLAGEVNEDLTPGELGQMIKVRKIKDLELLEVIVMDTNPERAAYIANSLSQILLQHELQEWKMNNLQLITPALPDGKPVGPSIILAMVASAVAGLFISVLVVLALDYRVLKE